MRAVSTLLCQEHFCFRHLCHLRDNYEKYCRSRLTVRGVTAALWPKKCGWPVGYLEQTTDVES
jgi:hypothetical protein